MADNYLERKMEEHARGASRRPAPRTPSGAKAGEAIVKIGCLRVLAEGFDPENPLHAQVLKGLAGAGCRVGIRGTGSRAETDFARAMGLRLLPLGPEGAVANVLGAWGGLEMIVNFSADLSAPLAMATAAVASGGLRPLGRIINFGDSPLQGPWPEGCTSNAIDPGCERPAEAVLWLASPHAAVVDGCVLKTCIAASAPLLRAPHLG